jgi:sirohydrochlorin ferrochelatase
MDSSARPVPRPGETRPTIVLLVAHGSRSPLAGEEHEQLCAEVQARSNAGLDVDERPFEVRPAYLEIAEPSIPDAIDAAVADGADRVRLLPHFLNSGNHVLRDLPASVAAANERHPDVEIVLAQHLGADPGLVDLLTRRVVDD